MTVLAFALLSSGPPLRLAAQRSAPSLIRMGTWLPEDMTAKGLPLPDEVESKLSDDTSRELTEKMWAALRGCYDTEAEAISAAERSMSTVLPYLNRPSNIVGSYRVLCDKLGADGARSVINKNPNVLSCNPIELARESDESIISAADLVDRVENLPIPPAVRNNLDKIAFLLFAVPVYLRIQACAGQTCG